MLLNLSTLRSELQQKLKNTTIASSRLDRWLNLALEEIVMETDPDHLITEETFTSTANVRKYLLENEFNKIKSIVDQTNDHVLTLESESTLESMDPDRGDTGTPYYYTTYGYEWVMAQPDSDSTMDIVSSSSSDISQTVRINYIDSNDVEQTVSVTLNGTTTQTTSVSMTEIQMISKDSITTGTITVNMNDSNNTVVARIGPDQLVRPYQPVFLYPTPSGANTYRVRGIRRPRYMVNLADYPDLPKNYHELVLIGAAVRGHRDLFRHELATIVYKTEYLPRLERMKREMGNKRGRISPTIRSSVPRATPIGNLPYDQLDET